MRCSRTTATEYRHWLGSKHTLADRPLTPKPPPPYGRGTAGGCVGGYLDVGGENTSLSL